MGEYDFLSGLDLGDLGQGIAGGTNIPNLGSFDGSFKLDLPNFGSGLSGLASQVQAPSGGGFQAQLPPGQGVMAQGQPTPDQGFGVRDVLGGIQSGLKTATPFIGAGLGALGVKNQIDALGLARQQARQQKGFQEVQQKSAQPLSQFGVNQLQQAQAGHVDPSVQAMIDQWVQAQKAQLQQKFAHLGITDSTMMQQALAQIDQQAVAMRADVLGKDKQTAIYALQSAMQGAQMGAGTANAEQQQLNSLIAQANQAMAALSGSA